MQCILALSSASLHAKQTGLQEFLGQNHTSPAGPDILINNDEQASVSGWTGRLCLPSVEGKSFKAAKTKRIFLGIRWKMRSFQCFSVALYVSPWVENRAKVRFHFPSFWIVNMDSSGVCVRAHCVSATLRPPCTEVCSVSLFEFVVHNLSLQNILLVCKRATMALRVLSGRVKSFCVSNIS